MASPAATLRRAVYLAALGATSATRAGSGCQLHRFCVTRPILLGRILAHETRGRSSWLTVAPFSSVAAAVEAKPASKSELLKVIDAEIKCAEECDDHDRVEEIPQGFPFEIQDEKGMNILTLRRTYHGEKVEVIVSMPSLVTGEDPERYSQTNEDGDNAETQNQSSLPLTVTVSKDDGVSLEFSCTAFPDEVTIDSMSIRPENKSEEDFIAYEGPDFNDFDENLQKAFHKYLELRGISAITTNFLHEYMINKDSHEYLQWLKNLKLFMEK